MIRILACILLLNTGSFLHGQDTLSLTADQALGIALEKNHGIRLARMGSRSAELLNNAGEAGLLPVVGINGQYAINQSATRQEFFNGEIREADDANIRALDLNLGAEWVLFDGLAMFATRERLATLELIGRTQLKQRIEITVHDVLASYYIIVQLRRSIKVQQEGIRTSRERLQIAEAGERIGTASGLAVVQARLDLSADSAAVLDLTARTANALTQLNLLLGQDPATPIAAVDTIPPAEELDLTAIQRDARLNNSGSLQAKQLQLASELSTRELRGALFPRVSVYGNYGYSRSTSAVGFLMSNESIGPDYGARLSIPLFNGGRGNRALQVAKLQQEQAALSTEEVQLQLEQQIIDGWTDYSVARQRVALEENDLGGIRRQVDVALESYRLGMLTSVELRDVQQGYIDAENRLLMAQYEAKMAELRLKLLAGGIG